MSQEDVHHVRANQCALRIDCPSLHVKINSHKNGDSDALIRSTTCVRWEFWLKEFRSHCRISVETMDVGHHVEGPDAYRT